MKFKSPVYSQVSGSVGGLTYAHAASTMYARARSLPTNPNTTRQVGIRGAVTALSARWNQVLTQAERDGWIAYANASPVTNKLGDPLTLSGQQMYIRCNAVRAQITAWTADFTVPVVQALVDTAPSTPGQAVGISSIAAFGVTAGVVGFSANLAAPMDDDGDVVLQAGSLVSGGRAYYRGPYQLAAAGAVAAAATSAVLTPDTADPEVWWAGVTPAAGDFLAWRARILYDDGRIGPASRMISEMV